MAHQLRLYMESNDLDNAIAKRFLTRICKAISKATGTRIKPNYYCHGMANLVSADHEIVSLKLPGKTKHTLFFVDAKLLLERMLQLNAILSFNPLGKDRVEIDTGQMFGTSIDELKIRLDLLKA